MTPYKRRKNILLKELVFKRNFLKNEGNFIFNKIDGQTNNCLREDETANIFLIRLKRFSYSRIQGEFMDSLFYLGTLKIYIPTYRFAQNGMPT